MLAVLDVLLLEAVRAEPASEPADVAFLTHRAVLRDDGRREVGGSMASVQLERTDGRVTGELQFLRSHFAVVPPSAPRASATAASPRSS